MPLLRGMIVLVFLFFRAFVRMHMRVLVRVFVRVRQPVVPVFMRVQMHMRMRMLKRDRVSDGEIGAEEHNRKRDEKRPFQMIPKQKKRENHA